MEKLTIQTLNMMVRDFSNEVTVNWLASKLGISYSTLVRCKNGVWPRSVTLGAMLGVFDECRDRYFQGDGSALAQHALNYLKLHGIDTAPFAGVLETGGYDSFVKELVAQARGLPDKGNTQATDEAPAPQSPDARQATEASSANDGVRNELERRRTAFEDVVVALPIAAILLIGLLNVPLAQLFSWASEHALAFSAVLLCIAVLPVVLGVLLDAPITWRAYRRRHQYERISRSEWCKIAKFGDAKAVVPGEGRFDLSPRHCAYQALCNILGALCVISVFVYLENLPGFTAFFEAHDWAEFFKVGVAVGFFVALSHNREHSKLPPCKTVEDRAQNPDNYLPSRAHVWANTLHLVITFSCVCILVLAMVAYGFANFRACAPSLLILWPYLQTIAFLTYSSVSPYAERIEALSVGAFVPGVLASAVGVAIYTLACFLPSWESAFICAVCAASVAIVLAWRYHRLGAHEEQWLARGRKAGAYSMAVVASLVVMLVIGIATAAL